MISVVSPVYNSSKCIEPLLKTIIKNLKKITNKYEIILIDDASIDDSWNKINYFKKNYKALKGIRLLYNHGQHYAIYAGIKNSKYNTVIVMDCDLQDNPKNFEKLHKIFTIKNKPTIAVNSYKKFPIREKITSFIFWNFLRAISLRKFSYQIGNFMIFGSNEKREYLKIKNVGFLYGDLLSCNINFEYLNINREKSIRKYSTYNFKKLFLFGSKLILNYNIITYLLRKLFFTNKKIYIKIDKII